MRNHIPYVPESFLSDLSPEAFDELREQLEMMFAACPEIQPYGSRLPELPKDWGVVEDGEAKH